MGLFVSISTFHVHTVQHHRQQPGPPQMLLSTLPLPPPAVQPLGLQRQEPQQDLEKRTAFILLSIAYDVHL
jgi:hypothetical protein